MNHQREIANRMNVGLSGLKYNSPEFKLMYRIIINQAYIDGVIINQPKQGESLMLPGRINTLKIDFNFTT